MATGTLRLTYGWDTQRHLVCSIVPVLCFLARCLGLQLSSACRLPWVGIMLLAWM